MRATVKYAALKIHRKTSVGRHADAIVSFLKVKENQENSALTVRILNVSQKESGKRYIYCFQNLY